MFGATGCIVEILWHRRETKRQPEKTNISLYIERNRSTRLKQKGVTNESENLFVVSKYMKKEATK
mgnify:CR=1 FL=1